MKKHFTAFLIGIGLVLVGVVGLVKAQSADQSTMVQTGGSMTDRMTRDCMFASGGWVIIDCSAAAAALSAQLNPWSRYVIQCGDDSYLAWGDSTTVTDTNDGWIPYQSWLKFSTHANDLYVSCRNKNADSDCRIIECR